MLPCHQFKIGDTYPLSARLRVVEDGVDVTEDIDFTDWNATCQYKNPDGAVVHEVDEPFVDPTGPVLDCTLPADVSATLQPGVKYTVDIRVRDENEVVRSTQTRTLQFVAAVSEGP